MHKKLPQLLLAFMLLAGPAFAQESKMVMVTIENIAPQDGVAITPPWVGFHNGSFDSYNGGLRSLEGLERVAEDGDNGLISMQFLDFDELNGGYTYVDNSGNHPRSRLVRTGDLTDQFRQDATLGAAPLLPGQSATEIFELRNDGSNDFFSYVSMVLPTNDFFIANGNPVAHDIRAILQDGGEITFFIGTPNGGVNDAGTERENFRTSAGNGLFPERNLPAGQAGPNQGRSVSRRIANVEGNPFAGFRLISRGAAARLRVFASFVRRVNRLLRPFASVPSARAYLDQLDADLAAFEASVTINVQGLDFNQYEDGIGRVTITVLPSE